MEHISIREAARRLGVNHAAVQKRIKAGTLPKLPNGQLDWTEIQQQWTANRDESKVRKASSPATGIAAPPGPAGGGGRNFADAKMKREYIRLEREALHLKRIKGELAPVGEINAWVAGMILRAREVLTRIGPELRDRLAQETNPHQCERLVMGEISRALGELSQFKPDVGNV